MNACIYFDVFNKNIMNNNKDGFLLQQYEYDGFFHSLFVDYDLPEDELVHICLLVVLQAPTTTR